MSGRGVAHIVKYWARKNQGMPTMVLAKQCTGWLPAVRHTLQC